MTLRHLPNFLKHGDEALALPRLKPEARLPGMTGTPSPTSRRWAIEWLRYLRAGRMQDGVRMSEW